MSIGASWSRVVVAVFTGAFGASLFLSHPSDARVYDSAADPQCTDSSLSGGWPDFDGDCPPEVVVGAPTWDVGAARDAGAVQYVDGFSKSSPSRLITAGSLGFASQARASFGATVVTGQVDGEGPSDVAIGAPGETVDGVAGAGAVYIVYGSTSGLGKGRPAVRLTAHSLGLGGRGGRFGAALAFWMDTLAIGEPLATVDGKAKAGRLVTVRLPGLARQRVLTQGHGQPGGVEPGDRFASSLANATYSEDLLVGSPYEDVGKVVNAGAVTIIGPSRSLMFTQNSRGVPGVAERGDHFGAAVSGIEGPGIDDDEHSNPSALIGAPDEDLGAAKDAGAIVLLYLHILWDEDANDDPWLPLPHLITAESRGFPGVSESGDRLGFALADDLVGMPDEDIGRVKNAGAACIVSTREIGLDNSVPAYCFNQSGPGVPGVSETGDRFGQSLGSIFAEPDDDQPFLVVVGAPGEDVGATPNQGIVLVRRLDSLGQPSDDNEMWTLPLQRQAGAGLGAALVRSP